MTNFDWIAPLEDFVRAAHGAEVPMVGVCFGHQLIAQALGGVARKSEKGWGLGRHVYDVAPGNGIVDGARIALAASHQDQVITPPPGAKTILSSDFTEHAGLLYAGGTTMSVQPHPEFSAGYALACCEMAHSKGQRARRPCRSRQSLARRSAGKRPTRRRDRTFPHAIKVTSGQRQKGRLGTSGGAGPNASGMK